jgi:hypothetical protein
MLNKTMKRLTVLFSVMFFLDTVLGLIVTGLGVSFASMPGRTFFLYLGYLTPVINSMFLMCMGWLATRGLFTGGESEEVHGGEVKRLALSILIAIVFIPVIFAPSRQGISL